MSISEELPGDHEPLDLARAFADRGELHVAKELLGRVVLHEAVAAVDLHAVLGRAHGDLARVQLRHRRLERHATALVLEVRGAIREQPRGFDARGVVRELPLDGLERGDRLPELPALGGVVARRFERALRKADRERGDADAAGVEHLQGIDEPLPLLAQQVVGGHAAVVEDDLARVAGAHARACLPCGPAIMPGVPRSMMNAEMPFGAAAAVGDGHRDHHVPDAAVRDEGLRAVQHPAVAVAHGGGPRGGRVAAGARFGQPPRADLLAPRERHEVALPSALRCRT